MTRDRLAWAGWAMSLLCCECVGREKGDRRAPVYRLADGEG